MQTIRFGIGLAIVLLGTTTLHAEDSAPAAVKATKPKIRTDAEFLRDLQDAVGAMEKLERDLGLYGSDLKLVPPKDRVPPPSIARQPADAEPKPAVAPQEVEPALAPGEDAIAVLTRGRLREIPDPELEILRHIDPPDFGREVRSFKERIALQELGVLGIRAWRAIGAAQARLGDLAAARRSWKKAFLGADWCAGDDQGVLALRDLALDQDAAGEHDTALETLFAAHRSPLPAIWIPHSQRFSLIGEDPFEPEWRRFLVLARAYDRVDGRDEAEWRFDRAIRAAELIENPVRKASALAAVAEAQHPDDARATWDRAKTFALSLDDPLEKSTALETIVRSCLRTGGDEWVLGTIGDGVKGDLKTYVLWAVVDELATGERLPAAGTVARVLSLAEKAEFDRRSKKERVFAKIAVAQARLGDEAAYRTLEAHQPADKLLQIVDLIRKLDVMCALAHAYLKAGKRDAAKDTVQVAVELVDPELGNDHRTVPLAQLTELVTLQAQTGDLVGALQTAELIEHRPGKVSALAAVAAAQGKAGDLAAARKTLARARTALEGITTEEMWQYADLSGTERVTRLGSGESRHSLTGPVVLISSAQQTKSKALHAIAIAQLTIGDIDGALTTAGEIKPWGQLAEPEMVAVYREIATARTEACDFEAVKKAMSALENADPGVFHALRRIFFREVTKDELSQGKAPGLLRVGIEIENKISLASGKLEALTGFAEGIVAFKNAEAPAKSKASEAKPVAR